VVLHCDVSKVDLESVAGVQALHPKNTECPQCNGSGCVPMHGGLPEKDCPRCGSKIGLDRR
jgi:ribosomal protein S27AE